MEEKNVFVIGSQGIPANYGGFETLVENMTSRRENKNIKYHVACMANNNNEFVYNDARCFNVKVPSIGPAKAFYYDIVALRRSIKYIKKNNIQNAIIYVLGYGIGTVLGYYKNKIHKVNAKLYLNPDGLEWKREKWNNLIKKFFKISEKFAAKHTDLLVCDSNKIVEYMEETYKKYNPKTTFIAYGSELEENEELKDNNKLENWYKEKQVTKNNYYLIVGRFVPENNYETMIKEFMKSNTEKDLVIITNVEKNKFYEKLKEKTNFTEDKRIKFVGTVYDGELLKQIRKNAYAYIHGHEAGGTNPSLLEALSLTNVNLLLDVGFNKEVGQDGAIYWSKRIGNLAQLINKTENISKEEINNLGIKAKERIKEEYNWKKIIENYEKIFLN